MLRHKLLSFINRQLQRLIVEHVGIDLGTVNTLIYKEKHGVILNEPSAIAINKLSGEVIAVGRPALEMLGREPIDTVVYRPMKDGSIADYDLAEKMLKAFLKLAGIGRRCKFLHVVTGTPSLSTSVERRALKAAAKSIGARWVSLVEEGLAAALGAGIINNATGATMVVDIGGGTSDITIASNSGIIYSSSIPMAGNAMTQAVLEVIQRKYKMLIGEQAAEAVKIKLGAALLDPLQENDELMPVIGKAQPDFRVREFFVSASDIIQALEKPVNTIVEAVRQAVEQTTPNVAADLYRNGITLTGGGSLLRGIDKKFNEELQLPVTIAQRPLEAVVLGIGKLLASPLLLERYQIKEHSIEWDNEKASSYSTI
ncbi:MAG: rod shape-determining protein [Acidobacteriota bacterium]|nr:rod shape-determining protein [Blastocatellia bacterium]MDW8413590.1 rod shape-determining protein [Acidobacteriota bacterium]